ncbi:ulp1 protease family, C-terminal catalytic domain-containing protein [Tanacetum coccineum]
MSRIPNDGFPNLNFSQLLGTTNSNQSSSSNPSTPSSQNSIGSSSQFPSGQFAGQFPFAPQYFPQMTPEQIFFQQQQAFQQAQLNTQFQNFQTQNVPETQFKVPQPQPPQKETRRKGKRMAKKSSFPAVDLSADGDNIEDEEDVVMTTTAPTQTSVLWTCDEEKLLCEVWVGVSENSDIGNDRNEECFWGQIHDDFNKSINGVFRITCKSGENDGDVLKYANAEYSACNKGKNFAYEHGWRVLKKHPKWDAAYHFDSEDHTEIFGPDARPRPPGKTRPAKKTKSETTESSAGSGSGSMKDVLNEELRQKIQAVYKWLEENIESVIGINKDDIDEEDDESSTMEPPSRNEAIKAAITLNNFLLSYEKTTPEVLTMLRKIRDEIQGEIDFNKKQKTIERCDRDADLINMKVVIESGGGSQVGWCVKIADWKSGGEWYVEDPSIDIPFIFDIDGRTLELGRQDFCLITGIRFGKISLHPKEKDRSQFRERVFPETPNLNGQLLLDLVKNDVVFNNLDDDDVVRVYENVIPRGVAWSNGLKFEKSNYEMMFYSPNASFQKLAPTFIEMNEPWLKSSLEFFTKVTTPNPATRGSSSSRSVHTCVRKEVYREVHVRTEVHSFAEEEVCTQSVDKEDVPEIFVLEKNVKEQQMQIADMQKRLLSLEDITKRLKNGPSKVDHNVDNNVDHKVDHNVDHIVGDRVVLDKIFKEQQLQILDMQRRLLSLEHITKTQNNGLSEPDHNVDHLDKNGNGSVSVQVGGLDHQSTEGASHCMYSEHLDKNWNDVSENHPVDGLDHQSVEAVSQVTSVNKDLAEESESAAIDGLISLQSHDIHSQPFLSPSKANSIFGCVDVDNMDKDGCITDVKTVARPFLRQRRLANLVITINQDLTRSPNAPKRSVSVPEEIMSLFRDKKKMEMQWTFPWLDDGYRIQMDFWERLVGRSASKRGWLADDHIDIWIEYLWHFRQPNDDWAMASPYLSDMLSRYELPLYYADGIKYGVPWFASGVEKVYFPVNEKDFHWCLAELHIRSGVITFYDSLGGPSNGIEDRLFWLELRQIFEFHIPTYMDYADVFVKKNIDKTNYSISFQYAQGVPIQGGLYGDCGLWVCIFLYRLSHNLPLEVDDSIEFALAYRERLIEFFWKHKMLV